MLLNSKKLTMIRDESIGYSIRVIPRVEDESADLALAQVDVQVE